MKKENIFGLLMYLVIFAIAVVYGLTVLQTHFQESAMSEVWQYAIYIVCCILAGVIIGAVLFEFGHVLGAKVGGYKIMSSTMLYLSIYKDEEKWKFGFKNFDGLTGETKIVPNYQKKDSPNPYPFLTYGSLFNLVWFVGCLILFFMFYKGSALDTDYAYAFLTVGLISLVMTVYNIIPLQLDTSTDGSKLHFLIKNKDRKVFNDLLLAQYQAKHGELAAEEIKKVQEPVIPDTSEGKVVKLSLLIDDKKFDDAKAIIEELSGKEHELSRRSYLELKEHDIYVRIMTTPEKEMMDYYSDVIPMSVKREISQDYTMLGIRTYLLMAGLFDKARGECLIVLGKVNKAYKNTPSKRKHAELVLFNEALEKVCVAHPKWELEIYKLVE